MIDSARHVAALQKQVARWRKDSLSVSLVPTTVALHESHLALTDKALAHSDRVAALLFVNPLQFSQEADFDRYHRSERADIAAAGKRGAHLVFLPPEEEMFAPDFAARIEVNGIADGL